jgi:hypothetical protein
MQCASIRLAAGIFIAAAGSQFLTNVNGRLATTAGRAIERLTDGQSMSVVLPTAAGPASVAPAATLAGDQAKGLPGDDATLLLPRRRLS